ncbi:chondroitinase-B domain-containing protein [Mariniflexile gromovii]|uniref:T9SS type A sorting domain-containing protein n=1 Tax=Mariniflexile gromovii TaxID=362523 RepID=A0ABS4BT63_9FLAO|nr:chondroitinase-B domain-containing protein [Mariniflexile gromovii]MBP0903756.1 T9SS type A sorting domain-containing protein [Mariniflexile gromovii]
MKKITTFLLLLLSVSVIGQTTYYINDPKDLMDQVYVPGDEIVLANGIYDTDGRVKFNGNGTADNPIVFRAETPGGVVFSGGLQMRIGGDYCVVDGFYWKGGYGSSSVIEFRDSYDYANHSTIQNCAMDGLTVDPDDFEVGVSEKHNWITLYGTYNTVINCSFMNKPSSGNMVLAELAYNFQDDPCAVVGHTISNNYFYKYDKIDAALTNSGDSETIRIGTSSFQNVDSSCTVNNNYFVEADGENEIITNKSKNNSYINNTFRRCRGSLVLRHGSHATVDGNYFLGEDVDGTGGVRIVDSDHNITNNYIQDCITVGNNAIWNNGITFLGGSANNAVPCTSTSVSNSYQKALNNNISNNTIVNTNAPLFFNVNTGTTNVTGTVSNNLIYFANGDANITPVISGNTATSYNDFGTALTYTGNVYTGTTLGVSNGGFAENNGITATPEGEIYTFSGASGKGANMGAYAPTTDVMVGHGIGACFLNNLGVKITDGNCTIIIPESLTVSSLSTLTHDAASYDVTVTANVSWTAASNDAWISIDTNSGTGDATVSITVTENTGTESRSGTVTFTQVGGDGDGTTKTLNVTQDAPPPPDPRDGLNLINKLASDVDVAYVSNEEVTSTKNNIAIHSLDKNFGTQWASNGTLDPGGSGHSIIIYDLKGGFDLDLVDIATTNGKTYFLEILVSSTGTANEDFTNAFPASGDLISNTDASFKAFVLPTQAKGTKYVKLIGKGQASSTFTTIHEIEFYGNASTLSIDDKQLINQIKAYPNPVSDILTISQIKTPVKTLEVFTLDGRKVLEKPIKSFDSEIKVDVSSFSNGAYILNIIGNDSSRISKMIIVSH